MVKYYHNLDWITIKMHKIIKCLRNSNLGYAIRVRNIEIAKELVGECQAI